MSKAESDTRRKFISSLADVNLVPTPVKYFEWSHSEGRHVEAVREEHRALLFKGRRVATVILSNAYGDPFVKVGWLTGVRIKPRPGGGNSPWEIVVDVVPPKKRKGVYFSCDFPVDTILIAWGEHMLALDDLPPLTSPLRWHCRNYPATWHAVSQRLHATAKQDVWLDTTDAAVKHWSGRNLIKAAADQEGEQ
jgi:hypothetical protein